MAYLDPRQYLDLLKRGQGGRATVFPGPAGVLQAQGDYLGRTGAPGWRERSRPYPALPDPDLQQRLQDVTGSALGNLQELAPRRIQAGQLPPPVVDTRRPPLMGQGIGATAPEAAGGPQGFLSKIGSFFGRPGIGAQLATLGEGIATESSRPGGSAWTGLAKGSAAAVRGEQQRLLREQQQQAAERDYSLRQQRLDSEEARRVAEDQIKQDQRDADKLITDTMQKLYDPAGVEGLSPEEVLTRTISATEQSLNIATINNRVGLAQVLEQRLQRIMPAGQKMKLTWTTAYDPSGNMKRVGIDPATGISYVNEGGRVTSVNLDNWSTTAPDKEVGVQAGQLERMNTRLGRAGGRAAASLVVDNQDLSLTGAVPPTYADFARTLGFEDAVVRTDPGTGQRYVSEDGTLTLINDEEYDAFIRNPENIGHWKDPSVKASHEQRVALAKAIAAQIVGDPNGMSNQGFIAKTFMAGLRASEWVTEEAQKAYVNSLNFINPVVRFLSGAQMTNQEALRYYSALVPMPGEPVSVTRLKRERRNVLLNAMGLDATTGDALAADDPAVIQALNTMGMNPANGPLQDMNALGLSEEQKRIRGNQARDVYLAGLESAIPIEAALAYKIEDYDESAGDESAGYEAL